MLYFILAFAKFLEFLLIIHEQGKYKSVKISCTMKVSRFHFTLVCISSTHLIKRPFGLYRFAFFPACNASSSDHPYGLNFTLSKHIPKTEDPNTEIEVFISL